MNLVKNSLRRTELSLISTEKREVYEQVFKDWETNGIVESVSTRALRCFRNAGATI